MQENYKYISFSIEFSANGIDFREVKLYNNASLYSVESYFYSTPNNADKMYYRIAAKDSQGAIKYSNMIMLRSNAKNQLISVFPNPIISRKINIKLFENPATPVDVTIYSMEGAKIYYNRFTQAGSVLSFEVPIFSTNVHYVLEVIYGSTTAHEQIMFK